MFCYRAAGKSLGRPGRKKAIATEDFDFHISYLKIIIVGILVLFIYITRLSSNEIFPTSNKIHQEVGRAKDLSAPRYKHTLTFLPKTVTYQQQQQHDVKSKKD
jgi:hypothetical protein